VIENPLSLESITMNRNPHTKPVVLEDLKSHVVSQQEVNNTDPYG